MKPRLPLPEEHPSYHAHRRQYATQILLPMLLAAAIAVAAAVLIGLATFGGGGDVSRWSAISTIWLILPAMLLGLLLLLVLAGLIYLLSRVSNLIPLYTARAQRLARRVARGSGRAADIAVKPIFFVEGIKATLKALIGRK